MVLQHPALTMAETPGSGMLLGQRYRLEAPVEFPCGSGRWRAVDEMLLRRVVVQFLPPGTSLASAELAAVRAAARLTDPRIARIFDADDAHGHSYLICEDAPGQPLDQMLSAGPLHPMLTAAITGEAARVLADAHAAGAPHLCLTPHSLRWSEDGLKITGLAVEAAAAGVTDTFPGAADTRALGQILYALLTGYWPGIRATGLRPAPHHRGHLCQPRQVRAGIPAALNAIACRALGLDHADPDSCFADPASLAMTLGELSAARTPGRATVRAATPAAFLHRPTTAAGERFGENVTPWLLGDCA